MKKDPVREQVVNLLRGGHAHATLDQAIAGLPPAMRGQKPAGAEHTVWQLLEHLRIAQWDILEFSRNPKHVSPNWPEGYWPKAEKPSSATAWKASVEQCKRDLDAMIGLVNDPKMDLYAKIPHGEGQNILRQALLVADHNAYHLGQIVLMRRLLGVWK